MSFPVWFLVLLTILIILAIGALVGLNVNVS
jgi:hypothetical protein